MRTTLELPDNLLRELLRLVKLKKKSEAVKIALEDFVLRKKLERLLKLSGKIEIEDTAQELEEAETSEAEGSR